MDFRLRKAGSLLALFRKEYDLVHEGSTCCALTFYDWKHVEFAIHGNHYVVRFDGNARWVLEQGGINVARCTRQASGSQLEFSIRFDDRLWQFKPRREKLVLAHDIWDGTRKVGRITPRIKFWWSEIDATFNQEPRLEIAGFAVWLVGIHWVGVAGKLTAGRAEIGV